MITATERATQAEFKKRFDVPYEKMDTLCGRDRMIAMLQHYFEDWKDDPDFRSIYKRAWVSAGYSEFVFDDE